SLKKSMTMFFRKSSRSTSAPRPAPSFQTMLAQSSKAVSWVKPRSRVMASYCVRPGDLWLVLGSPPSRCWTTSVVRFNPLILSTPATYLPSHFTLNLKFLYGSRRVGLTVNSGICDLQSAFGVVDHVDLDDW